MTAVVQRPTAANVPQDQALPLETGDHLDQTTFHARYAAMPEDVQAELIEGVVYMASPVHDTHGESHLKAGFWITSYEAATPGTRGLDNTSTVPSEESEVQPDVSLLIRPECGGQTRIVDGLVQGAPELVVEVASSSVSYDLHSKKRVYEAAGVREYVVVQVREPAVLWFVLEEERFVGLPPDGDGLFRSRVFPGLWLDPAALLRLDTAGVRAALERGLASPEHAAFVERLRGSGT